MPVTQNRLIVTIDNDQDLTKYANKVGARLIRLNSRNNPKELDLFRLDKYQTKSDIMMFIGPNKFIHRKDLFKTHIPGKVGRYKFDLIMVDKTSPRIFQPVFKRLSGQQIRDLIESRIEEQGHIPMVGVGTELKKVLSRKYKAPPCELCEMTSLKLNLRGIIGCEDTFDEIVDEVNDNAKNSNNFLVRHLAKIGDAAGKTKPLISESLTEAIQLAKASTFVYPFIYSEYRTKELELSIKSIRKFFDGEASIFVFGDDPEIEGVTHVPMERLPNKHEDQLNKLRAAIDHTGVTEEFVWMMDDIYFLKSLNIDDLRLQRYANDWTIETIEKWLPKKGWNTRRRTTLLELHKRGQPFKDYSTHLPHVYTKTNLRIMDHQWGTPYLWDILYSNLYPTECIPMDSFFYRWEGENLVVQDLLNATIANSNAQAFTLTAQSILNKIIKGPEVNLPAQGSSV